MIGGTKGVGGMRSDTTIVVHVSADRSRAELVSIPRDSLVAVPSCTMTNGKKSWAQRSAMFNTAFATGWDMGGDMASAAGCTIKTVQALTGLTIDHFVVVDFVGFESMVNAIGGVPICLPTSYDSPNAGLHVNAGFQALNGQTALAYARAREGTNMNGSDLQRAARQQQFVAAMIRQVLSKDVLTSVPRLLSFLDAATKSLTVDPGLSHLTDMAGIALSLRGPEHHQHHVHDDPGRDRADRPQPGRLDVGGHQDLGEHGRRPADRRQRGGADDTSRDARPRARPAPRPPAPTGATTGTPTAGANPSQPAAPAAPSTPAPLPKTYHPGDPFTANDTAGVCG